MTDPLLNILTLLIKVLILLTVPTQTQGQAFGFADKDKNYQDFFSSSTNPIYKVVKNKNSLNHVVSARKLLGWTRATFRPSIIDKNF